MVSMSAGKQRHKMIITPVWGTPEFDQTASIPQLHVVSISGVDGARIREALAKGPVEATLKTEVDTRWREVSGGIYRLKGKLLVLLEVSRLLAIKRGGAEAA
jgi:hypothetical protein